MRKPKITYDTTPRYTDWTVRDIPADECFDLIDRRGRALATLAYGSCSSARPDDLYNRAVVLERVELICQAVNAHGPLVEALSELIDASRYLSDEYTEKWLLDWCECEPCPECGKEPKDCTGTPCSQDCSCNECRYCHLRMATVQVGEGIEAARAALALARPEVTPCP